MYGHRNITSLYNLLTTCLIILLVKVSTTFFYRYSGYNQIFIAPKDQEKTNLTCPYGTFRFKRLTFKLCNAPMTFQHCVMFIFSNMVKDNIQVFMDIFLCNLELDQAKFHLLVKKGIVLVHWISQKDIEVNKVGIEVMEKSPPPISVKGVTSFLRHYSFYRIFFKICLRQCTHYASYLKCRQSSSLMIIVRNHLTD